MMAVSVPDPSALKYHKSELLETGRLEMGLSG